MSAPLPTAPPADAAESGLALARAFYDACRPSLLADIPDIMARAAVGLVGEGSECFGCDDALSRDHDFGPSFCLWLPQAELATALPRLETALARLPKHFGGYASRLVPQRRQGRVGPLALEPFYAFFTGLMEPPAENRQWLAIPECQLAACTNGEVFADPAGLFSRRRAALLAYYPEDVRLKKLTARCMIMAQAGQYNLPRCLRRGDGAAALLALARFVEAALSLVYLCNRRYMPFYKWAARLATPLPVLGAAVTGMLGRLRLLSLDGSDPAAILDPVEAFCAQTAELLRREGLSDAQGDWLWAHGPRILRQVADADLRRMDLLQA
ncbi:DUF4037 domain-containing protein [Desulfovibrio legallii]|uniref:DUF4037 domain-containing protein n=1 Tax=Desulfovibrio legallii TaxID=571438 RepID=A0A1G7JPP8_9BACT|nr:DUF4037 domain-containing protein [Desulfovibrio legallii]SDF26856.1 protein of unknown function [Desulfovibrio legallii]